VAITINNLTSGVNTGNTSKWTLASVLPTSGTLLLLGMYARSPGAGVVFAASPTIAGAGATWVKVQESSTNSTQYIGLYRAMPSAPTSVAITVSWSGATMNGGWSLAQFSGVSLASTDGAGAIVQSTIGTGVTSSTTPSLVLGAFSNSSNASYGLFGQAADNRAFTTGVGMSLIASVTNAAPINMAMLTEWRLTTNTTVDAVHPTSVSPARQIIAVEIASVPGGVTDNLAASILAPASVTATLAPFKKLNASITASATITEANLTRAGTDLLTASLRAAATVSASLGQIAQGTASVSARASVRATLNVTKQIIRAASTDVYDFTASLLITKDRKRWKRTIFSTFSPKNFQQVEVTTTPLTLVPDANARWVLLTPQSTNPYSLRMVQTDASIIYDSTYPYDSTLFYDPGIGTGGAQGFGLSSVNPSLIAVSTSLSSFSLFTTLDNSMAEVGIGYL
jgi:hypothetical protein